MTKRSHQIASRQAAISRERKRKKKPQTPEKQAESSAAPVQAEAVISTSNVSSNIIEKPARAASVKPSQPAQQDENRFQYVVRDIRKIAIVAVPLVLILIVLAFVL